MPITVSGQITAGTQASGTTTFLVTDSESASQQSGTITAQSNGTFSFNVPLAASRAGNIKSGRQYTITVTVNDAIGNQGSCSAVVTVPHDQGK
jgi:VCBS repeat-containing protein